jgi:tRNA G18 (ribose-2'-O)-methylase SpoU
VVVLEDLVDHDNIGSAFRNAAGFGASAVLLSPSCADPLYRKSVRTSMGHILRVPFGRFGEKDWPRGLDALRERGFAVAAMTPADDAIDIDAFARTLTGERRLAILLGSEGPGLSTRAMRAADARVSIPMAQGADSINVAAALAVALHALRPR